MSVDYETRAHESRQAKMTVQKLVLYAQHKRNLDELRAELLDAGITPGLLDMPADDLAELILKTLTQI